MNNRKEESSNVASLRSYLIDTTRPFDIEGIPLALYALLAILAVIVLKMGILADAGVSGAFAVLWTVGLFFFAIGERVWVLKALLGGGLVVAYAGAAITANLGFIAEADVKYLQSHIIGNRFLYFVLATLLISSVLSVRTAVLRKSLVSYAPIIFGGLLFAAIGGLAAGKLAGIPVERVVTLYFLPIMGGGTGAGAIPMSEVFADVTNGSASEYFNYAIAVLTLGNIAAILTASLLNLLGQKFPKLSGDGKLVRGQDQSMGELDEIDEAAINTHAAMFLIVSVFLVGLILSESVGVIHLFAWVTIIAVLLNITQVVSPEMRVALNRLSAWGMRAFLVSILVAFGLSADFEVIATIMSPGNLFVIVSIVVGSAIGAGVTAHFVNCYAIEGALSGGLCMANAGGSGDLQVLGAARRLELFPYAQLSSRLGGAFMLVLANYLFGIFN